MFSLVLIRRIHIQIRKRLHQKNWNSVSQLSFNVLKTRKFLEGNHKRPNFLRNDGENVKLLNCLSRKIPPGDYSKRESALSILNLNSFQNKHWGVITKYIWDLSGHKKYFSFPTTTPQLIEWNLFNLFYWPFVDSSATGRHWGNKVEKTNKF